MKVSMSKITIFFIIWFLFSSYTNGQISQLSNRNVEGLWIEIHNEPFNDQVTRQFLSFETIKNDPIDTVLTEVKNEKTKRTWLGANLCELLNKRLNISCNKIISLSITAPDGYTSVLSGDLLFALRTAICAYRLQDQDQWNENYGYMRLIFPELRGMYWVNSPEKIVITIGDKESLYHQYQFYFVENKKFNALINSDLKNNSYFVVDDILVELNLAQNSFSVLTSDGLFREYPANDINRYFLLEKDENGYWQINGINLPSGLKMKQICFLSSGNKGIFLKNLNKQEKDIWERLFWKYFIGDTFSTQNFMLEIVFNNGKRMLSNSTDLFVEGKATIFEVFEKEWSQNVDIAYLKVSW